MADTAALFEAGKKAQYDAFWDRYQDYGDRRDYTMLFAGAGWTPETFKPKYKIIAGNGSNHYMTFPKKLVTMAFGWLLIEVIILMFPMAN